MGKRKNKKKQTKRKKKQIDKKKKIATKKKQTDKMNKSTICSEAASHMIILEDVFNPW